ncbi:cyclase family protein [Marinactinospora rubrisoli]|uniref:Cyclase family protein n=1 Tax=Marinactinospora rubrisoli TaxID=2715399 RepID=A0ABW2KPW6_9ACTN
MRIIDLSTTIDADNWEPDPITHTPMTHRQGADHMAAAMREHFNLDLPADALPDGEFLNNDTFTLTAHTGTHIDAPAHYGSTATYGTPRTIDQLPLDWFHGPGVLLDVRTDHPATIGADRIRTRLHAIGHHLTPGDIVLLHTGADTRAGTPAYFTHFAGLDHDATHYLLDHGVRVIGTDAFSLDAPFPHIIETYRRTNDPTVLWPAHVAGRHREYCQIERLANLGALPAPTGFTVMCLPVKLARAGAGWTRAVALIDE